MGKQVRLIKSFTYGNRTFKIGEIGDIVETEKPFSFQGVPFYDLYAKFEGYQPVGLLKGDYEIV